MTAAQHEPVPGLERRSVALGIAVVTISFIVYYLANRTYDAGRGDFFYLADAFLAGRTWLDHALGPWDIIQIDDRIYVPFAPFPAIAFMPIVALIGPEAADAAEPMINAALAASAVGLSWVLFARIGVARLIDRVWLAMLFGFSTQLLWVTTRGGVWHTGHLIATILTLACLLEIWGGRRAWLIGLLAGAAFLTRAPLAFAVPFYALLLMERERLAAWSELGGTVATRLLRLIPWRAWALLTLGSLPAIAFFFLYNQLRFGTPFEAGYAIATLPEFLERQRALGLFSLAHVPMNLEYFLFHLPRVVEGPPYLRPDGLGLSVLITSPALLYAARADLRDLRVRLLLAGAVAILVPTFLYYGGGWYQYGYRYFLDSVPFIIAACAMAAAHRGRIGTGWTILILAGVIVMAVSIPFAYGFFDGAP